MNDNNVNNDVVAETLTTNTEIPEAKVAQLEQKLMQQEKLTFIGELTAGILHEIKNPLNFVNNFSRLSIGMVEELKELVAKVSSKLEADEAGDFEDITGLLNKNLNKILDNGQRAERVILNILAQTRENKAVEFVPTNLNELVDEFTKLAYQGMRGNNSDFNLTIKTDYDPSIGMVSLDAQDFTRVILNIVGNSCYALNEKKLLLGDKFEPELKVTTKKCGDDIIITVGDNGIGIPKSAIDKIYNAFFTTKPSTEGTGLGLYISHKIIVDVHKGKLTVESEEGESTVFTITIPVNR